MKVRIGNSMAVVLVLLLLHYFLKEAELLYSRPVAQRNIILLIDMYNSLCYIK